MDATADSSSDHHPAGATVVPGGSGTSPHCPRSSFPSPWAQVVRGELESVPVLPHSPPSSSPSLSTPGTSFQELNSLPGRSHSQAAPPSPPPPPPQEKFATGETSDAGNVNASSPIKKTVWNKPSDGILEVNPAMGADSWPALSESAKPSSKFQSESSLNAVSDGSNSSSQEPVNPPLSQKHATTNAKPNSTSNHTMPVRRYNRRGNNSNHSSGISIGGGPPYAGFIPPSQTPPPSPFPPYPLDPNTYGNLLPPMPISQQYPLYDHRSGTSQRANLNPNMHGNGYYHHSRVRPNDQRRHYGNARDVYMQQQQQRPHPRSVMAHPSSYAPPAPFLPPSPVRGFGNHMGYQEFVYYSPMPFDPLPMEHHRGPPLMPPTPTLPPYNHSNLAASLINQIDYYFCNDNLVKDTFLRSYMDDEGWVSVDVIANFPRVKKLTGDSRLILDCMRYSDIVEVQDNKMRARNDWLKWIPNWNQDSQSSSKSNQDTTTAFRNLKIEEVGPSHTSTNGEADTNSGAGEVRELPNGEVAQNANSSSE